jgi:tyrosyl-tRNA synthetase
MTVAGVLDDLKARGLVQDCTDPEGLAARLAQGPVTLYYGCDPTADSLHVGNLIGLLVLRRFQEAGHRPIALAGGATGIGRIVDLSGADGGGLLVDNRDWTGEVRLLDFLRDIGKHVTVNTMLARESVKNRLASEHGISFTEFSYMLLQANDFLRLEEQHGCQVQIGGSDQWGNILGGVDLIRRVHGRPAWALAWPLLTAPDGTKLGKTTGARIWLDPVRTSPYQFFQHWMGTDDRQVRQFLAQFTLLPLDTIDAVVADHEADPGQRTAQRRLAVEVTTLVHSAADAAAADAASAILFGAPLVDVTAETLAVVAAEVPSTQVTADELQAGLPVADLLARDSVLTSSKGEARRALAQGGVYVNGERVSEDAQVTTENLLAGRYVLLRKGKKAWGMAVLAP